ncbi:MepB family protein [Paenibacillus bovis]|uniref:MepB protein n=1 Tax=Paenibacillus bovis TaxID=1616788 RepID=A0A172ZDE4_9BACL|nr:MepB family protein [Paenibacillus bovis]ANF95549.1 hypothetical protein AR543_05680 [Paenibacillus bovis]
MNNPFASLAWLRSILSQANKQEIANLHMENQNFAYEGMTFKIGKYTFRSRRAKPTPKKKGYFVVFWEKDSDNNNQAYSYEDCPDHVIVHVIEHKQKGQFIFPRELLLKHGVLRTDDRKGKMAIRVYPDWEKDLNTSASSTQKWQLPYFIKGTTAAEIDALQNWYLKL